MSDVPSTTPFPPEVVAAVCHHMNDDHVEDSLLICRALGNVPDATSAHMTGLDAHGGDFTVTVDGTESSVRIPWAEELTERPQIRAEVVRLYRQACALLGVPARGEDDH